MKKITLLKLFLPFLICASIFIVSMVFTFKKIPFSLNFGMLEIFTDSQQELGNYSLVIESEGKKYNLGYRGGEIAFDRNEKENHLYGEISGVFKLENFIALCYNDFKFEKTDNPFFDGEIKFSNNSKYIKNETKYKTTTKTYTLNTYFDNNGQQIYTYQSDKEGQEFVQRLYPKFEGSRKIIGSPIKDEYIDITAFLQTKCNKKLRFTIDDEKKFIVIRF